MFVTSSNLSVKPIFRSFLNVYGYVVVLGIADQSRVCVQLEHAPGSIHMLVIPYRALTLFFLLKSKRL